ncbi:hypothetical protein [Oceanobacillus saliphilus]|uniref:hypothetical protein n=1 Tax=Oceanobacillus saliphilus TaxID=2925834 RepID=UPI00201E2579|nr:hypothetical protein [Oceanobacillus saliphilus]
MLYNIIPQRLTFFIGFSIVIIWNTLKDYFGLSSFLFLFVVLLWVVVLASIRLKFKINDDHLVYQIVLFNKSIIKKEIYPNQINQLKFIRVGWAKKAAIIKVNKGVNIRLSVLEPPKAYEHLIGFAEEYDITILKTKDYLILERMK